MFRLLFVTLGVLGAAFAIWHFGQQQQLPEPIQERVNDLRNWVENQRTQGNETDIETTPDGPTAPSLPARSVQLPDAPFVPLALLQEAKRTHLVYLAKGKARHTQTKGVIVWSRASGLSRLVLQRSQVPVTGPKGARVKTVERSHVVQLLRVDYADGQQTVLHPQRPQGIRLEAEDLEFPEEAATYFLREERSLLSLVEDVVSIHSARTTFLGGAHPAETATVERVSLVDGAPVPARFSTELTAGAAKADQRGEDPCVSAHVSSVALRGPGGVPLPAAVLGAAYESCRGSLRLVADNAMVKELVIQGVPLGGGAAFRRGAVYVGAVPLAEDVVDAVRLDGIPAALIVQAKGFQAPLPDARRSTSGALSFLRLARTGKPRRLTKVGALMGSSTLPPDLPKRQLELLRSAFGIPPRKAP